MVLKNLPWTADWLARAGYAGHLVRDLSNTHVMIVGGGTLISTGLCWYVLPRIVARPLSSPGLAQGAFWFTAVGLLVFYIALIANGIAMGRLVSSRLGLRGGEASHGQGVSRSGRHRGGGDGPRVLVLRGERLPDDLPVASRARAQAEARISGSSSPPAPPGLTVGTVQGVIQVQPAHADWLYKAGHAGEWIDPISHAHINLVTGLTMLTAGALFALAPRRSEAKRRHGVSRTSASGRCSAARSRSTELRCTSASTRGGWWCVTGSRPSRPRRPRGFTRS